jgi:hypothetical protein
VKICYHKSCDYIIEANKEEKMKKGGYSSGNNGSDKHKEAGC